jgi:adenylosuccinate lyase
MIERYTNKIMNEIWSENSKYEIWFEIEKIHLKNVINKFGIEGGGQLINILPTSLSHYHIEDIKRIENEIGHDLASFVDWMASVLEKHEKSHGNKYPKISHLVHYGLTSSDVVDTTNTIMLKKSIEIIMESISNSSNNYPKGLNKVSFDNMLNYMMAKTHGQPVEPTSIGVKLESFGNLISRRVDRLEDLMFPFKVSGSTGHEWKAMSVLYRKTQVEVANKFKIKYILSSTQALPRQYYTDILYEVFMLASEINNVALQYRLMHRDGVIFKENTISSHKGSSSIPLKSNPIEFEKINGLFSVVKGLFNTYLDNNALFDERDISNSSIERVVFPDIFGYVLHMIATFNHAIEKYEFKVCLDPMMLTIYGDKSTALINIIIPNLKDDSELSRDDVYKIVKKNARKNLNSSEWKELTGVDNVNEMVDLYYHNKPFDEVFTKVWDDILMKEIPNLSKERATEITKKFLCGKESDEYKRKEIAKFKFLYSISNKNKEVQQMGLRKAQPKIYKK